MCCIAAIWCQYRGQLAARELRSQSQSRKTVRAHGKNRLSMSLVNPFISLWVPDNMDISRQRCPWLALSLVSTQFQQQPFSSSVYFQPRSLHCLHPNINSVVQNNSRCFMLSPRSISLKGGQHYSRMSSSAHSLLLAGQHTRRKLWESVIVSAPLQSNENVSVLSVLTTP